MARPLSRSPSWQVERLALPPVRGDSKHEDRVRRVETIPIHRMITDRESLCAPTLFRSVQFAVRNFMRRRTVLWDDHRYQAVWPLCPKKFQGLMLNQRPPCHQRVYSHRRRHDVSIARALTLHENALTFAQLRLANQTRRRRMSLRRLLFIVTVSRNRRTVGGLRARGVV